MRQKAIPFLLMRGGSSRGPFFNRADLPADLGELSEILISVVGSGHPLNIDGVGGGNAVTTKVAMLSESNDDWADIDYFFAQVSVDKQLVDYKPTCGNMLTAIGPAAIEMGLVPVFDTVTEIKIRAVNTGAKVIAKVQTPNGQVSYFGDTEIDGVPGTSAPIELLFLEVAGSSTGHLFPTGNTINLIQGVEVTCMDVAMPMVIARASDFGLSGHETREELDANREFFGLMESIRIEAGELMGMDDVSQSVTPKFGLLSSVGQVNHVGCRYFMPWETHPTVAVTGSQCLASCALAQGTVADGLMQSDGTSPVLVTLHHPMGTMDVLVDYSTVAGEYINKSAGLVRTARKIAGGEIFAHLAD
ncbi:4-oxalomesaconate tautomerase [Litoricolaceae bacterium]|nr:4-oxalomesaconate tautomerase [Litorivicinaceae bacterium]